jgi:DNA segregation ATPase FtsK/SpoIIIE, S-DNA-T family
MVTRAIRWWWHAEQTRLRSLAVVSGDAKEWRALHKDAQDTRRGRGLVLLGAAGAIALGAVLMWSYAPWWGWALLALVLPLRARAGRPAGKPIIRAATTTPRFRVLNADIVLRAYYATGLGHPDKPGQQVTFGSPMARDGDGSRVLVDLPFGKGLDDAVKGRPAIASGLDVSLSQVFIHRDPTSHRRHTLWVADRDPLAVPVGRTPLLACKATDIWKPAPIGLDERGQLVTVPILWNSVLVGALPRAGKTFSARLLALYAALDPFVKLDVYDFKGSPDWRRFALVANSSAFGLTPRTTVCLALSFFWSLSCSDCVPKALIAYLAVKYAPVSSPMAAMPLTHVGTSPQAGGSPLGLPEASRPTRKPIRTPRAIRPHTSQSVSRERRRLSPDPATPWPSSVLPVVMGEGYGSTRA